MIVDHLTDLIGRTPMLRLKGEVHGIRGLDVYLKLEMLNPFGSIKDRTAWALLRDEIESVARDKKTIFETSSGNTAKAIAGIASAYGVATRLVSAPLRSEGQKRGLLQMGVEIEEISGANDCFDPNNQSDPQYLIERAVAANPDKIYFPGQFKNKKNVQVHYDDTGAEIISDLGGVDYFFGGMGTIGSSAGIAKKLREVNRAVVVVGVCAQRGHSIPGIREQDMLAGSPLYEAETYQEILSVKDTAAIEGMIHLNRTVGLMCGPSTGASYSALVEYFSCHPVPEGMQKKAVMIACDRYEPYLDYVRDRRPDVYREKYQVGSFFTYDVESEIEEIAPADFSGWVAENHPLIIDMRAPMAYGLARVRGAINIPLQQLEMLLQQGDIFPKEQPVVLMCAVGERSRRHVSYLSSRGYRALGVRGGVQALVDYPDCLVR